MQNCQKNKKTPSLIESDQTYDGVKSWRRK